MIDAKYISEALNGKPIKENSYECDCPLLEHRTAKMIVTDKNDIEPLIYCYAGCSFIDLKNELLARGLWPKKKHTARENREIRQKIERKAWEKAKYWILFYEHGYDSKHRDCDHKKYAELTKKYKYQIWATKTVISVLKTFRRDGEISAKQFAAVMKAADILN